MSAKKELNNKIVAMNLFETIIEKIEDRRQVMHPSTFDHISKLSLYITNELGVDFVEDKRGLISEQLTMQILNSLSTGSKLLSKIGMGKSKIRAGKLNKLVAKYILLNKRESRIYYYEKNILPKIKQRKITRENFSQGIKQFAKMYEHKLADPYKKVLFALNEKSVGRMRKSELAELRKLDPISFDNLVLTSKINDVARQNISLRNQAPLSK